MKEEIENKVMSTVKTVKEDVQQALEIERRKGNLIMHRMPQRDVEQDVDSVDDD